MRRRGGVPLAHLGLLLCQRRLRCRELCLQLRHPPGLSRHRSRQRGAAELLPTLGLLLPQPRQCRAAARAFVLRA